MQALPDGVADAKPLAGARIDVLADSEPVRIREVDEAEGYGGTKCHRIATGGNVGSSKCLILMVRPRAHRAATLPELTGHVRELPKGRQGRRSED